MRRANCRAGFSAITNLAMLAGTVVFPDLRAFHGRGAGLASPNVAYWGRRFAWLVTLGLFVVLTRREDH
jgi:hypothetical protein